MIKRKERGDEWILERQEPSFAHTNNADQPETPDGALFVWRALNLGETKQATTEEIAYYMERGYPLP